MPETNLKKDNKSNVEFTEGYALSKISKAKEGRNFIEFHIIDENKKVAAYVSSIDGAMHNLFLTYDPMVNNVFDKIEELKKSAKLGKFTNGIAKIEVSAEFGKGSQNSKQSVVQSYYVTRSGLLLADTREVNGKLQQDKKELKLLKSAQEIWDSPEKFRKLRAHSGLEESSSISKIIDRNVLNIATIRAFFDVAQHSLDEKLKQAEKDRKAGIIDEEKFNEITKKISSNAKKNLQHLSKHERTADIADRVALPVNGLEC